MADIATKEHWEKVWGRYRSLPRVHPTSYPQRRLARIFAGIATPGCRVLDVGCGASRWLAYCQNVLGCEAWGVDYSKRGVELARQVVGPRGADRVVLGDFFDESLFPPASFDFIYSLGVIEHFTDAQTVTRRLAALLRPGGRVLTAMPNLDSAYGMAQKIFDRSVYDKHLVFGPRQLDALHAAAGLVPVEPARYFGCFGPALIHFGPSLLGRGLLQSSRVLQYVVCNAAAALKLDKNSRFLSPQVFGVYTNQAPWA